MAVRKVITTRDPRLREKSKPIEKADKKLLQLIKDLEDTLMAQKDPEGVGLAAPQIGINVRVFVMLYRGKITPVVNPEILAQSESTNDPETDKEDYIMEGCLSLPYYYGPVKRALEVTLKYQTLKHTEDGSWHLTSETKTFKGFSAQIIQHEVDHLNGKVFIDRLLEQSRKLYELKGKRWQEINLP